MLFSDLSIIEPILRALHEEGYRTPTPIQQRAIPVVLEGKDLLGIAQTGTGKTAAFAVPILQILSEHKPVHGKHKHIRCLILTPTRELAVQIQESFQAYGRHVKLSNTVIFGGVGQGKQTDALKRGVDIVVATPGRLLDLIDQGYVNLRQIEIFVLDEADRMLDMGFVHDVQDIIAELPKERQTLFFSATMPPAIVKLSQDILYQPVKIAVTPPATTVDLIQQKLYYVDKSKKLELLMDLLDDPRITSALVFTRTKRGADVVARTLERSNISAEAIHGNKAQNARQRSLTNFKSGKIRVLVATDIAARGIDIDNLQYVFNYEIPNVPETYVHRIGRTGRAGANGIALSFCAPDEKAYVKDIEKLTGVKIPVERHAFAKPTHQEHAKPQLRQAERHPQAQHSKSQHPKPQHPKPHHPKRDDRRERPQQESRGNKPQHPRGERPSHPDQKKSNQRPWGRRKKTRS
jgi:ATP-dependent RNA helicase RhlE